MTDTYLTITATPNPENQAQMAEYLKNVMPMFAAAGGKPIVRQKVNQVLSGNPGFVLMLVMTFPSAEAIQTLFSSAEYAPLIPIRDKAFSQLSISITGPFG
ncbi:MAG: DUF1330 domain-containing protein [Sneathiella sp.]|nr:DUF1330 domain-containing protein [Sneathiella sp.]